jgi:MarR family transcriptional regulator, organic hydroperoxide resistance regulator
MRTERKDRGRAVKADRMPPPVKDAATPARVRKTEAPVRRVRRAALPLEGSVGYQVRMTHRMLQRALQVRIAPHGVTLGMWYYLRALWDQDGQTQRELSRCIGTMEPTTLSAIATMEREGLVRRERNTADRRKIGVFLTDRGKALEALLLPAAIDVVRAATRGLSSGEVRLLLDMLQRMQLEMKRDLGRLDVEMDG